MIIDVHVHVFPPAVIEKIDTYLCRDEFLKEICTSPVHKYATVEDLLQEMDRCGVDKSAISGFASSDEGLCREMNEYVLEAAARYPERLIPMAVVNPFLPGMEKMLSEAREAGVVGVGELFPWGQGFPLKSATAARLAALCSEMKLPLLLHVNENVGHHYTGKGDISVKEAAGFAADHQELVIIFAHWGGGLPFYELMPELKGQLANVYYDTAAGPFLYEKSIYRVAREIGILDKILLGTDYPLLSPRRYLRELEGCGLTDEELNKVCGGNALRLFFGAQEHVHTD